MLEKRVQIQNLNLIQKVKLQCYIKMEPSKVTSIVVSTQHKEGCNPISN